MKKEILCVQRHLLELSSAWKRTRSLCTEGCAASSGTSREKFKKEQAFLVKDVDREEEKNRDAQ